MGSHLDQLGGLVGNFQALEGALRAYLYEKSDPPHAPFPVGHTLDFLAVGDVVPVNAMTDFSTLRALIDRYNNLVRGSHPHLQVDHTVVQIRDAIAHGRVFAAEHEDIYLLLKFERPSAGTTRVEFSQMLTEDWLKSQTTRIFREVKKILQAPGTHQA